MFVVQNIEIRCIYFSQFHKYLIIFVYSEKVKKLLNKLFLLSTGILHLFVPRNIVYYHMNSVVSARCRAIIEYVFILVPGAQRELEVAKQQWCAWREG